MAAGDSSAGAPQAVTACGAPAVLSPAANEHTSTTVFVETSAPSCLVATKCYLDAHDPPVTSGDGMIQVAAGAHTLACNGWDASGQVYVGDAMPFFVDGSGTCTSHVAIADLVGHNTSASPTYDRAHFAANFGTTSWVSQSGQTITIDPAQEDMSLNPVTPGHVSNVDVHSLLPSRPDLRWFAHVVPWFGNGSHIDIGLTENTAAYAASLLEDVHRRGFDGVVIDWYGQNSFEDQATLQMQTYLHQHPELGLKLIIMIDKGVANLSQAVLSQQLHYLESQSFGDSIYELENGQPIVMFFGVTDKLGATVMSAVKSSDGGNQVWVLEGSGALSESFDDQAFDWANVYTSGPNATDPYDLSGFSSYYANVSSSSKHAFGAMLAGFNGTLTKTTAWSKGKYIPRDHGACLVARAARLAQVIPANVTRMQWVTWSDWEEGSQVEGGVENDVAIAAQVTGAALTWTTSGGTGDESTIDHYAIYASNDGANATLLGSVPTGTHTFSLAGACLPHGTVAVIAVGKPMIRDHASVWIYY